jgi:hypothetical protein
VFDELEPVVDVLEPVVDIVLESVPEFRPDFLALVEAFDDDPGGAVVLTELAGFVAERLEAIEVHVPSLHRALAAVDAVARRDEPGSELVAYAFLDSLSPDELRSLAPWFGDATRALVERLELGG